MSKKQKKALCRILLCIAILLGMVLIPKSFYLWLDAKAFYGAGRLARFFGYALDYFIIGREVLKKAFKGIKKRQVFDENFLMAVATVGAFALAIWSNGEYVEAIAVMLFYQIGELFESYAVGKSRRSIGELMDIRPDSANVEIDGRLTVVDPDEVEVGTIIVVQPGERVPIDGVVVEGISSLNTSALTGESMPRDVREGMDVISGCINLTGVLKIRTTKVFGESTVSRIMDLVENASSRKSRSEDFIAKFSRIYTPCVCYAALALAVLPPVALMLLGRSAAWGTWFYRALTFLVISCPCALVISIPLSFFAGIGGASRRGVLIKGSNYLETLSKVTCIVFDKTGTLTRGAFEVEDVYHAQIEEKHLLELAAHAESASSHPISRSLQNAYDEEIDRSRVSDVVEVSGHGVIAMVDGRRIAVGNDKLMAQMGVECVPCIKIGTLVHVAEEERYLGHILISDQPKPNAASAVAALKRAGVKKLVMLTGDRRDVADAVAQRLGINEVYADLLPTDKVGKVEELLSDLPSGAKLTFVGDGINDAPVLARADIGIAMGALGSDAAIEAADVVLMDDDPAKIVTAIAASKKCLRIVYENIIFAIGVKVLCLLLGALGITNMWAAIFADVGVMVLAVLNAIRVLFIPKHC